MFEDPLNVEPKDVDAVKLLDQPGLVGWPVDDVSERSSLVQRDGLVHQHNCGLIFTPG